MKDNMFCLTPANKVCFICDSNSRMGACEIYFAWQVVTTALCGLCGNFQFKYE